jgi:hypothetical protein
MHMEEERNPFRFFIGGPERNRSLDMPIHGWNDIALSSGRINRLISFHKILIRLSGAEHGNTKTQTY